MTDNVGVVGLRLAWETRLARPLHWQFGKQCLTIWSCV